MRVSALPAHVRGKAIIGNLRVLRINPDQCALRLVGDCLVPVLRDGDRLVVSATKELKRGDCAVVFLRNGQQPKVNRPMIVPPPGRFQSRGGERDHGSRQRRCVPLALRNATSTREARLRPGFSFVSAASFTKIFRNCRRVALAARTPPAFA
jgi:hypothetical protein